MQIQKFVSLMEKGWSLDHIFILENIEDVAPLINFPRGAAMLQTLLRKGVIDENDKLTQQGKMLLEYALNENVEAIAKVEKPKIKSTIEGLHKKLEDKLLELTGKKQVRVDITGSKYSFLCNEQDLVSRIKKVMAKYKLSDVEAIEKTLLNYVDKCYKRNRWYPLIAYFIIKNINGIEQSQLVTELKNMEEDVPSKTTDFEI